MATQAAPPAIYHLKITLSDAKPPIWRDILVPSNLNLEDLHYVIQTVMGWDNSHLHQFIADKMLYVSNADEDNSERERQERKYNVSQLLATEKSTISYEYDFGDSWLHTIELKKILPVANDADAHQPRCIRGRRACPPEDSGGIWGYSDMLDNLKAADDIEKEELLAWLGSNFDPEHFDIEAVNGKLKNFFRLKVM